MAKNEFGHTESIVRGRSKTHDRTHPHTLQRRPTPHHRQRRPHRHRNPRPSPQSPLVALADRRIVATLSHLALTDPLPSLVGFGTHLKRINISLFPIAYRLSSTTTSTFLRTPSISPLKERATSALVPNCALFCPRRPTLRWLAQARRLSVDDWRGRIHTFLPPSVYSRAPPGFPLIDVLVSSSQGRTEARAE